MPRTRRELLSALREKINRAIESDPEAVAMLKRRMSELEPWLEKQAAAGRKRVWKDWFDEEISDDEFNLRLEACVPSLGMLKTILDPAYFPPITKASSAGNN